MRVKSLRLASVVALLCVLAGSASAQVVSQSGKIDSVTVYRGQALVTREVPVSARPGLVELVVSDLPSAVRPDSLYAHTGEGFEVRAVRFRTRAVGTEPREQVRKLDDEIEAKQKEMRENQRKQEVLARQAQYLDKLEQFVAPTAQTELTKGVLNAKTLVELTNFTFEKRASQAEELLALQEEDRKMKKELDLLQRKRRGLAGSGSTVREAVVFLDKRARGDVTVRLSYLVSRADWSPSYVLRASGDRKKVRVEYTALVNQTSGEDWSNVQLTLSTAAPSLVAQTPELGPLWVGLVTSGGGGQLAADAYRNKQLDNIRRLRQAASVQRNANMEAQADLEWDMNDAANRFQTLELLASEEALKLDRSIRKETVGGLSATYELPTRVSLASRSDRQMLQISALDLSAKFYHVAAPVLSSYVYQQAEIENSSKLAFLEGTSVCYLNGEFVGQGRLPMVASGQKFAAGFGIDAQLSAARELVSKEEKVQGGNKELTFKYRLLLENFKEEEVRVRLVDRLPKAKDADIRLTLGKLSDELSDDPLYLRTDRPNEILRWEISVPARSAGSKARTVEYDFKLEFDRNKQVTGPRPQQVEELRQEFEKLKGSREAY